MKKLILIFVVPVLFAFIQPAKALVPPYSASLVSAVDYSGDCGQTEATIYSPQLRGVFTEINLTLTGVYNEPIIGGNYIDRYNIIVQDGNGIRISQKFTVAREGTHQISEEVRVNTQDMGYIPMFSAPTARPWTYFIQDTYSDGSNTTFSPMIELFTFDPAVYMPSCASLPYVEQPATTPLVNAGIYTDELSVYNATDDNGEPALHIYDINNEGNGTLALEITQDIIAPYLDNPPAENTELMTSENGNVTLYILDTGELQINRGPDEQGKTHVLIFDGIPPTSVYGYVIDPAPFPFG